MNEEKFILACVFSFAAFVFTILALVAWWSK